MEFGNRGASAPGRVWVASPCDTAGLGLSRRQMPEPQPQRPRGPNRSARAGLAPAQCAQRFRPGRYREKAPPRPGACAVHAALPPGGTVRRPRS
jgi:hypothetical protein